MKTRLSGFATITAMASMILMTAFLAVGVVQSSQATTRITVIGPQADDRRAAWTLLDQAMGQISETWDSRGMTFSAWSSAHPVKDLVWNSLSGRINLNTFSAFLVGSSSFGSTLNSITPEEFNATRAKRGPKTDPSAFADLIRASALESWYTTQSLWNLNTCDEVMLELMVSERTSSPALGSALRAWVRGFRSNKALITKRDWETQPATIRQSLEALVTWEPELDVNEASPTLLVALLTHPTWQVTSAASLAQNIAESRLRQPWTKEALSDLLQLPSDHPLHNYLGTTTRFIGGTVTKPHGVLTFVLFRPQADQPAFRIISTQWSPR